MSMDTKFPLKRVLKGRLLKIAELQDRVMLELASRFNVALHGGTAIWRVYGGKRFSFDIDVYYGKPSEIAEFFSSSSEFTVSKSRVTGSGTAYLRFEDQGVSVELEASRMFKPRETIDGQYFLVEGDSIIVRTLSAESLLQEKIEAFKSRGKARDLYDIFHLLGIAKASRGLGTLLPLKEPKDFGGLREIILLGKVPDFATIERLVKMYAKEKV